MRTLEEIEDDLDGVKAKSDLLEKQIDELSKEIHLLENAIRNRCPELFEQRAKLKSKRRKIKMELDFLWEKNNTFNSRVEQSG